MVCASVFDVLQAAGDFAKLLHADWSLEEDKLIVTGQYFDPILSLKAIEKVRPPMLSNIVPKIQNQRYLARQMKDPYKYNKVVTVEMLRIRAADLQHVCHTSLSPNDFFLKNTTRLNLLRREIEVERAVLAAAAATKQQVRIFFSAIQFLSAASGPQDFSTNLISARGGEKRERGG